MFIVLNKDFYMPATRVVITYQRQ